MADNDYMEANLADAKEDADDIEIEETNPQRRKTPLSGNSSQRPGSGQCLMFQGIYIHSAFTSCSFVFAITLFLTQFP